MRLWRVTEAAEGLAVAASTVNTLIDRGDLPHVRIGRAIRVREDDLQAYVERGSVGVDQGRRRVMADGEGSLYRRSRLGPVGKPYLRWVAQVSLGGRDERRLVRRICPTKQEAKAALVELRRPAEPEHAAPLPRCPRPPRAHRRHPHR